MGNRARRKGFSRKADQLKSAQLQQAPRQIEDTPAGRKAIFGMLLRNDEMLKQAMEQNTQVFASAFDQIDASMAVVMRVTSDVACQVGVYGKSVTDVDGKERKVIDYAQYYVEYHATMAFAFFASALMKLPTPEPATLAESGGDFVFSATKDAETCPSV